MARRHRPDQRNLAFDFDEPAAAGQPGAVSADERHAFREQLRTGFAYSNPLRTRSLLEIFDVFLQHARRNAEGLLELEATETFFAEQAGVHRNTASSRLDDLREKQVLGARGDDARNRRPCGPLRYFLREDVLDGRCGGDAERQQSFGEVGAPTSANLARQLPEVGALTSSPVSKGVSGWRAKFPSESELKEGNSEGCASEVSKTGGGKQRRSSSGMWGFTLAEEDLANGPRMLEFFDVALRHGDGCVEDSEQCRLNFLAFAHSKYRQWKRNQRIPTKRHSSGVKLFLHNLRQPDQFGKEWDDHTPSKDDEDWARRQLRPARAAAAPAAAVQLAACMSVIDPPPKQVGFSQEFRDRMRRPGGAP